ncbi:MAG: hypothetical protein NC344_06930 [Bacteroidales bacterium]|nr:hypothetical protein [Bacteroidales bacterium]
MLKRFFSRYNAKVKDCVTRIFWDSSSEMYMYDTTDKPDNDFPIQEVAADGSKPGLMSVPDKKKLDKVNTSKRFVSRMEVGTITPDSVDLDVYYDNQQEDVDGDPDGQRIPAATSEKAGVMSAGDKKGMNYYDGMRQRYIALQNVAGDVTYNADSVTIGHTYSGALDDIEATPVAIQAADGENAGVMPAEDKRKLNRMLDGPVFHVGNGTVNSLSSLNAQFEAFITNAAIPLTNEGLVVIHGQFQDMAFGVYQCVVTDSEALYMTLAGGAVGSIMGGNEASMITIDGSRSNTTGKVTWEHTT